MCIGKHVMQSVSLNDTKPKKLVTGIEECTSSMQVLNGSSRYMYVGTESGTVWYVINPGHYLVTPVETGKIYYWAFSTDADTNGDGAKISVSSAELAYDSGLITSDTLKLIETNGNVKGTAYHKHINTTLTQDPINIPIIRIKLSNSDYKKGYIILNVNPLTTPIILD